MIYLAKEPKNQSIRDRIQSMIDNVYADSNYTSTNPKKALTTLKTNIDTSINNIIDKNVSINGSNLSRLYSRVKMKENIHDKKLAEKINEIFSDDALMDSVLSTYMDNKYIKELDDEIDIVCKYYPKLEEAIEAKIEMILSADDFTKIFANIRNISDLSEKNEEFSNRIRKLRDMFKLAENFELTTYNMCKYGEDFIYSPPYSDELSKILAKQKKSIKYEFSTDLEGLNESAISDGLSFDGSDLKDYKGDQFSIQVEINENYFIGSILEQSNTIQKAQKRIKNKSIVDIDSLELPKDDISQDGLINRNNKEDKENIDVPGCISRRLERANVIPLYIDDICLGYYYIESDITDTFEYVKDMRDPLGMFKRGMTKQDDMMKDDILKKFSSSLSKIIDKKFINSNQDITKEIYLILKHNMNSNNNTKIRVTYIPPEHMHHFYFRLDPKTHRGVSDIIRSLFPAKLWVCVNTSNAIGILTRSFDKRVYYVKQLVDTNIAQLMHNTIANIKKSNFGMREINNINNVMGVIGRYNDHIIPVSQSGDKPIDIEVLQGQDIDTKPDYMEALESQIMSPTGVPLELIDTRRTIEYSRQLTFSNGRFARHVLKRQAILQPQLGRYITILFNHTYTEDTILEVLLPPPTFLFINNTLDLLQNTQNTILAIIDIDIPKSEVDKPWVDIYRSKLLRYYLGSYLDFGLFDRMKKDSMIEAKLIEEEESVE